MAVTYFVFDYDDTLLCTTLLETVGIRLHTSIDVGSELDIMLKKLADAVVKLLKAALEYKESQVYIITNSQEDWVQLSVKKFLPAVEPYLDKVTVISARSQYEGKHPYQQEMWKYLALKAMLGLEKVALPSKLLDLYIEDIETWDDMARVLAESKKTETEYTKYVAQLKTTLKQVISLGDSHYEHDALLSLAKDIPGLLTKVIKFKEQPSGEELIEQMEYVTAHLQTYVESIVTVEEALIKVIKTEF